MGLLAGLLGTVGGATEPPGETSGERAYRAQDFGAARRIWQVQAESGDVRAAFDLGLLYDLGQGVKSDASVAYGWYLRAAEQGDPQAEFNVGVMSDDGRGTARNAPAAACWYARAAAHGLGRAAYALAQLYETGDGVPRNLDAAATWYQDAARDLPAAATRLRSLSAVMRATPVVDGPLAAPLPIEPPGSQSMLRELVWAAPPQPAPVRYYVTVVALGREPPVSIYAGFVARSAIVIPALAGVRSFAWRVWAVGISSPHYAAGPWQIKSRLGER